MAEPSNHGEHKDHGVLTKSREDLVEAVIGAAIEVHRELGPGLLESAYEAALALELSDKGISATRQVAVPALYKGRDLGVGFRADIVVDDQLLLEIKSTDGVNPVHVAQVITYLKLLKIKVGLVLNFNGRTLKEGIKRISI